VAHLTIEAVALGLSAHQMAGFDGAKARELFDLPEDYETLTIIAIGYQGELDTLTEDLQEREKQTRTRKPMTEFVFSGHWNQPLDVAEAESLAATH
ncbi:MAG: nitroreductase, partial [Chloroflexota bacterium]